MTRSMHLPLHVGALSAIAFAFAAPSALAQEAEHQTCRVVGNSEPEQIGDRAGHALSTELDSCRIDSGPMAGAIVTSTVIWEWDGPKAKLVAGGGIVRKPGSTSAFHSVDGNVELTMSDGKVTGATASGHTLIDVGAGSAVSLQGKSVTWTAKATGPNTFEISDTIQ
jgi:hypothetical protein